MIDGFWILMVQPPPVTTGGVVMFIRGKVFGGDNAFTWIGTYSVAGQILKGRVHVHNFDPETQSVLGVQGDCDMYFSGVIAGDSIAGTALIANQPQHSLALRMEKHANL